ncbi:MAG: hypothetical protein JWQ78_837 [Sediminibacterium sp.]|nr:hypothetical protein [Sediminibacterium sp.]
MAYTRDSPSTTAVRTGGRIFLLYSQINFMSDNKKNTGVQDAIRVDSKDPGEVEYLHSQYPNLTHQQIKDAIAKYGPMRADIVKALES